MLVPSRRIPGGYRLYSDADLRRLQRILYYRLLDVDLDTIARLLSEDQVSVEDELRITGPPFEDPGGPHPPHRDAFRREASVTKGQPERPDNTGDATTTVRWEASTR